MVRLCQVGVSIAVVTPADGVMSATGHLLYCGVDPASGSSSGVGDGGWICIEKKTR